MPAWCLRAVCVLVCSLDVGSCTCDRPPALSCFLKKRKREIFFAAVE